MDDLLTRMDEQMRARGLASWGPIRRAGGAGSERRARAGACGSALGLLARCKPVHSPAPGTPQSVYYSN